jgi:predicted secreted protein
MSCLGFLSPAQRAALAASSAAGAPLSAFASPPASASKVRRVRTLAASGDVRIRESAALSYHAPAEVLAALALDAAASVRACVARNPGAALELLWALADDPEPVVRGWVAAHPGVPADLLERLAADPSAQVRAVVAWARGWA